MDASELAAAVLEPHFDAVRDAFATFEVQPGEPLSKLRRTRMVVNPLVHDSPRHFAMCRDDGLLIEFAPELARQPLERTVAITCHEFGHAADFAYPGRWIGARKHPALWVSDEGLWHHDGPHEPIELQRLTDRERKRVRKWQRHWHDRSNDQVEWAADSIAWAVTGKRVSYCGPCMVQCFSGGARPVGVR